MANLVQWRESSYFDTAADLKPLLHLWSLGIEEQFYVAWPLVLAWAARRPRRPALVVGLVGAVSFAWAIHTVRLDRTAAFFAPWTRVWELLVGAALAVSEYDARVATWTRRWSLSPRVRTVFACAGLAAMAAGVWLINGTRVFPGLWALLPVLGAALVVASGPETIVHRAVLAQPLLVWVGLISYPLYLWHWPLLSFARLDTGQPLSTLLRLLLLGTSVVLAAGTYYLVERPLRFGSHRRAVVAWLSIVMVAIAAAGFWIADAGGLIDRPVNRGDAARLVDYYERLHKSGLADAYRRECDFMEWGSERTRDTLDTSCTAAGSRGTVLLWGDSFAQALSQGLRESLPRGVALAQVATSSCAPQVEAFDLSVKDRRCETTNEYAMAAISRLKPRLVIVAQASGHAGTNWAALISRVRELGASEVVVVGPFPLWRPSLPRIYAELHLGDRADYVGEGLVTDTFDVDRLVARAVAGTDHATYVSLLDRLCREATACLAKVPGAEPLDLMAIDFGHLSPPGSSYVGRLVWAPLLATVWNESATHER